MRRFLEACLGVLEASAAMWRPSWASWTDRGATRSHLGGILKRSWSALGRLKAAPRRKTISDRTVPGYFSSGDPQGPPRAREVEIL